MQKNRDVLRQVGGLAAALLVCIAVMLAVYALLGRLDRMVLLGAFFGWLLAVGNFLSLSITVSNALDRAANGGSPQKAQLEIQTSSVVRPLVLALIYIVLFRPYGEIIAPDVGGGVLDAPRAHNVRPYKFSYCYN